MESSGFVHFHRHYEFNSSESFPHQGVVEKKLEDMQTSCTNLLASIPSILDTYLPTSQFLPKLGNLCNM